MSEPTAPAPLAPPATTPPGPLSVAAPAATGAAAVATVAAEHQAMQAVFMAAVLLGVLDTWAQIDPLDWLGSWRHRVGERVFVQVAAAQEAVADEATTFVTRSLAALGQPPVEIGQVVGSTFAGRAADGRSLETLLIGAPIAALQRSRRGAGAAVAREAGANYLRMVVRTELPDAGRMADQSVLATAIPPRPTRRRRRTQYGWVRMLRLPSCTRCIVLAGRFYRWNEGFQRHENCDCRHIPSVEAVEDDLRVNPYAYFHSLTREQQNSIFGKANATAIRAGADINQVLNASTRYNPRTKRTALLVDPVTKRRTTSEGTTRRGFSGRSGQGVPRPTPWQVLRDANGDQDEVVRLLKQFGYILR